MPSEEIINCIIKKRNNKYEEAIKEYIFNCDEYKKVFSLLGGDERNIDAIFDIFKNIRICVCGATQIINNHFDLISLMFYTFRAGDLGTQFYAFMHECGHIIENNENGFGFDIDFYSTVNDDKNPYNNSRRKYELFNETINDIFTIEAVEILHKLNIFPIEKKEYTITDLSNVNTSILSKQILYPLVNNYRSQLIKAKITSKIEELTEYIGVDNFENLVDIVNRVEYLVGLGLLTDLENNQVNDNVNEYYSILERVENIYNNIDSSYTRFKLTK